jgi:hypothetical protein
MAIMTSGKANCDGKSSTLPYDISKEKLRLFFRELLPQGLQPRTGPRHASRGTPYGVWVGVRVAWASMLKNAYFEGFLFDVQILRRLSPRRSGCGSLVPGPLDSDVGVPDPSSRFGQVLGWSGRQHSQTRTARRPA